jgi:toxin ParE1/3/4
VSLVRWTHSARRDYRNIVEWLSDRSPAAAVRVADAIDNRLGMLAAMPRMGRIGRLEGTRELVISGTSYVLIYDIEEASQQIVVLRLLHAAQLWPPKTR